MAAAKGSGSPSTTTTRRRFLGSCGVIAGATALPHVAGPSDGRETSIVPASSGELATRNVGNPGSPSTLQPLLTESGASWKEWTGAAPALRRAYLLEVERLAGELRPRFEAGEMHGAREENYDGMRRLEAACASHFGLTIKETEDEHWTYLEADAVAAHLVLAASPSTECSDSSEGAIYDHEAQHAIEAVSWDVLALARERAWYTPTEDELPDADELAGRLT
jgi:hypothetical protein